MILCLSVKRYLFNGLTYQYDILEYKRLAKILNKFKMGTQDGQID